MATNPFFQNGFSDHEGEQNLLHDLAIENIQMSGQDMYYIPRKQITVDKILNEVKMDRFDDAYCIEMYILSTDGLEGAEDTLGKFGFELRDELNVLVARKRFLEETQLEIGPMEGDLIYIPINNHLMEIMKVERDKPFLTLGTLTTWSLHVRNFRYNYQTLTTGLGTVDALEKVIKKDQDIFANNQEFHRESRKVLDFNESNPFGEL